jgi:hypothetical protein
MFRWTHFLFPTEDSFLLRRLQEKLILLHPLLMGDHDFVRRVTRVTCCFRRSGARSEYRSMAGSMGSQMKVQIFRRTASVSVSNRS